MHAVIEYGENGGSFWVFKFVNATPASVTHDPLCILNSVRDFWPDETCGVWDWSAYDSLTFSYNVAPGIYLKGCSFD